MIKVLLPLGNELFQHVNAELLDEKHAIYYHNDRYFLVSINPTDKPNVFKADLKVNAMLSEDVKVQNRKEAVEDLKKLIKELSFYDYLTRVCNHYWEYDFNLIGEDGKVKKI